MEVGVTAPFADVDWSRVFLPETPILEIVARGAVIYLGLFTLLRFTLKRQSGVVGITDLLVIVLIADAAQNAMAAEYTSVADGFVLVSTILACSYTLDWLGHKSTLVQRFVHPPPLPLVKNGRMLRANMRKELITEDELMTQLRKQGAEDLSGVEAAYMEGDGSISVICANGKTNQAEDRKAV
jgi:uncharacterized membrane protein YcaP (DUF421 family)